MTEAAFVTVCCYFCECMWTAVFFQKHSLVAKIFLLHTCFQPPWVLAIVWCLALRVCVCVCLLQMKKIAKMKGPGLGLVCCRLCVMSFARCRMKLPPPLLTPTFPLWPCCSGREGRSGEEWPRCNQQTLWAPSWVPASCLYACLIGQKQHGWLCSQGTDIKDLAYPHMSYVLVIFFVLESAVTDCVLPPCISAMCVLGHVYCQSSANHPLLCITRESACYCRCRLACLHCCCCVVTWFQPTFKMAE